MRPRQCTSCIPRRRGQSQRHDQENGSRNFQPQLVRARPNDRPVARTPLSAALSVRLRPACSPAARATTPNFRKAETVFTASILTASGATMTQRRDEGTVPPPLASKGGWRSVQGDSVDQQLKQLMKELGDAINESLSDSEQISEVVSRIKEGGYDIFLVLEATIGVSKQGEKSSDKTSLVTTINTNPEFKISDQDLKFLKSLRIKIDEEKQDKGTRLIRNTRDNDQ